MQAEFIKTKQELPDVYSLWFKPPSGFTYHAGDYTELSLGVKGIEDRRWLSIASSPHEPTLQFTVKIGSPPSQFKAALLKLTAGQIGFLSPPMGNFNLPNRPDKLLFIAGGVGITPFRSMILGEGHRPIGHDLKLFYAAKPKQHLFQNELKKLGQDQTIHSAGGRPLTLDTIRQSISDIDDRLVFLAGPQPMMEGYYSKLIEAGHPRWRLRLCYFDNYQAV